jgi:hypothetical protein
MKSWRDYTNNPNNKWVVRGWPIVDRGNGMIHEDDCPIIDFCEGEYKYVLEYAMKFPSFAKRNGNGKLIETGRIQRFADIVNASFFTRDYGNEKIVFRKV